MSTGPYDIRADFFGSHFNQALPYADYLKTANPTQLERWRSYSDAIELRSGDSAIISTFARRLNLLTISGIWCGDCMRQGPMLEKIAAASSLIDLRFLDNNTYSALRDELRIAGGARVPIVLALSEDFYEVGRFGDRTLAHYRAKARREIGPACDSGLGIADPEELQQELSEWLQFIERMQLILRLSPFLRTRHHD